MENASKALIIAGAILLSILLISLGIMIYNQAAGVINNNSLSEVEIATFNSKFTQYEGENVRGSSVNALLDAVMSNNRAAINAGEDNKKIVLVNDGTSISLVGSSIVTTGVTKKAQTGKTYTVKITEYGSTGLVKRITISNEK
jgi:hypothetical protein